ncbi:MAG: MFS transporter, partial [Clostridiaceae bacterium]|nr:MFS transporter [Clostridiaceae bacterium]
SKWAFIVSTLFVLFVVLAFTGGLNIAAFKKNYTNSLVGSYTVLGGGTVRKIEYAVKYGKPLDNFFGMKQLLQEVVSDSEDIKSAEVILTDGRVAYDINGNVQGKMLHKDLLKDLDFSGNNEEKQYVSKLLEGEYHTFLPLRNREGEWIGSLDLIFDEEIVVTRTGKYLKTSFVFMLGLALISALILVLLFFRIRIFCEKGEIRENRIMLIVLSVLAVSQVLYAVNNIFLFRDAYNSIARENTMLTAQILKKDIGRIVGKGISLEKLYEVDRWMETVISPVPEIEGVFITGKDGKLLYSSGNIIKDNYGAFEEANIYVLPLEKDDNETAGTIKAVFSKNYMTQKVRDILLDAATIFVTSFFFLFEITLFMILFLKRRSGKDIKGQAPELNNDGKTIRTLAFIMFMGAYMSISFIPILTRRLYQPFAGLSEGIVIGLPISAELFCCGISTVLAGFLIDKKSWRHSYFIGAAVFGAGLVFSGMATNTAMFIAARGIVGFGYGLWLMAMRSYVASAQGELEKSQNISAMNSGAFAGLNCGSVLGGMLADRVGFSRVFYVAVVFIAMATVFAKCFFGSAKTSGYEESEAMASNAKNGRPQIKVFEFFTDYKVLTFFLLIIIPTGVCGMFLEYIFPVFAEGMNVSSANISRAFLLNGMCVVILGPVLSKYFGKHFKADTIIIVAAFTTAAAMLVFYSSGTIAAGYISAALLGLSSSFGVAAQSNYFLKLDAVKNLGRGKALGFFSNVDKFGQMAGPMIFGSIIALGTAKGVGIVGLAFVVLIFGFLLVQRVKRFE